MKLLIHALTSTAVSFNHRWSWDMDEWRHPQETMDVITYPFLKLGVGLDILY